MINKLIDISMSLPISMLPSVINKNNDNIQKEFNKLYDDKLNRLLISLYNPTGSVIANTGEFKNIQVDNLTIKDTSSLYGSIKDAIQHVQHNVIGNRFSTPENEQKYISLKNISHDAGSIVYKENTVENILTQLLNDVSTLKNNYNELHTSIPHSSTQPTVYGVTVDNSDNVEDNVSNIDFSYDKSYLYASPLQLKRKNLPTLHLEDIKNGKLYTYHKINNGNVNISDDNINIIETINVGVLADLKFINHNITQYYYILLSRKTNDLLKVSKDKLNRVQLKCTDYSDTYGAEWDIYNYSCLHENDLEITKLN